MEGNLNLQPEKSENIDALKNESKFIPKVNLKIIPSLWGHIAGAGFAKEDANFINNQIIQFFE